MWSGVPYDPMRLYATLGFMLLVVGGAVSFVRWRYAGSLIAEIATTLGIFLLAIGAIVYTAAFRGLRVWEMTVAWLLSGIAITWFVGSLNRIMTRPLRDLDRLGASIRRGDWSSLLATSDSGSGDGAVASALHDVAVLIEQTQRTADSVLEAAARVSSISAAAADSAETMTAALERVIADSSGGLEAASRIRVTAGQIGAATQAAATSARQTLEISTSVESQAQVGVERADRATASVSALAAAAREVVAGVEGLRDASATIGEITNVVNGIVRQTNLLALNAAIEAARAGEYGKGFAVVADEVRKLAAESGRSLQRIEELVQLMTRRTAEAAMQIEAMRTAAGEGEREMGEALAVFRAIAQDARRTHQLADGAAGAARRQEELATRLGEVAEQVVHVADSTAATTGDAARATARQRELTDHLRHTGAELEASARSLGAVVSRFGVGSG